MAEFEYFTQANPPVDHELYGLPHEVALLDTFISGIRDSRLELAPHINEAVDQSSETSHDNSPVEVLLEQKGFLDKRELTLVTAKKLLVTVPYPKPELPFATIGSRVVCDVMGDVFSLDITGNLPIVQEDAPGVESGSFAAPMPRALLGAEKNDRIEATIHDRIIVIGVISVDQIAQRSRVHTVS